jgi:protein-L-isoaspartate(D-aspartate) O-methyltransferase
MRFWPHTPIALSVCISGALEAQDWAARRQSMIEQQIVKRGIRNPALLRAISDTPRHLFVPIALQGSAYEDRPLPIGHGQTISQPYIVASMTDLLDPRPTDKILEIGTGSGYQAAILARLAGHVYSIEIVDALAKQAALILRDQHLDNITIRTGDGYQGWPEQAPFDKIILTAAPPEIPPVLLTQLKPGGRLIAPIGTQWQELVVFDKDAQGKIKQRNVYPVVFVPMVPGRKP